MSTAEFPALLSSHTMEAKAITVCELLQSLPCKMTPKSFLLHFLQSDNLDLAYRRRYWAESAVDSTLVSVKATTEAEISVVRRKCFDARIRLSKGGVLSLAGYCHREREYSRSGLAGHRKGVFSMADIVPALTMEYSQGPAAGGHLRAQQRARDKITPKASLATQASPRDGPPTGFSESNLEEGSSSRILYPVDFLSLALHRRQPWKTVAAAAHLLAPPRLSRAEAGSGEQSFLMLTLVIVNLIGAPLEGGAMTRV
ncbi:hypothetical protein PGT21_029480 [Puccinia graminis f. sp. tritici]|uniref:Uncharacterized protein n=1 Tax=Puccinia graminis f. sp. tritici TaxID=56615 RepID=A0A5B0NZL2_PUCGR|nr:hypothetical protein PGT21_029480 [Puccinia graminis f. sp. tritici]